MTCREMVEFLMEYLNGELAADQRSAFEAHIELCPPCLDYLSSYKTTIELGREACTDEGALDDAPEQLVNAILAARRG